MYDTVVYVVGRGREGEGEVSGWGGGGIRVWAWGKNGQYTTEITVDRMTEMKTGAFV